jgi:hypothetical protein
VETTRYSIKEKAVGRYGFAIQVEAKGKQCVRSQHGGDLPKPRPSKLVERELCTNPPRPRASLYGCHRLQAPSASTPVRNTRTEVGREGKVKVKVPGTHGRMDVSEKRTVIVGWADPRGM